MKEKEELQAVCLKDLGVDCHPRCPLNDISILATHMFGQIVDSDEPVEVLRQMSPNEKKLVALGAKLWLKVNNNKDLCIPSWVE